MQKWRKSAVGIRSRTSITPWALCQHALTQKKMIHWVYQKIPWGTVGFLLKKRCGHSGHVTQG